MDTPWICLGYVFNRIPKTWIRIGSDTGIRHVFERVELAAERRRKEGLHGPRAPPRPDPPELGAVEHEVGELDAAELGAEVEACTSREEREPHALVA